MTSSAEQGPVSDTESRHEDPIAAQDERGDGMAVGAALPESWRVELPIFAGPLDLLLHLVRINEVEITDIPVAQICDQFHEYLRLMEELNLDIAAEYIYEAALLIHLKSKLLLPRPRLEEGEEAEDPRRELVERLLQYQQIKQAAQTLAEVDRMRQGMWTRPPEPPRGVDETESIELGDVSLFDLLGALQDVLRRYDREHPPAMVVRAETFTVRDQIDRLLGGLDAGRPLDFLADLAARSCRAEVVAAFLAVLELARLQLVRVHQGKAGALLLYRTTREVDHEILDRIER